MPIALITLLGLGAFAVVKYHKSGTDDEAAPSRITAYTSNASPTFDLAPSAAQRSMAHSVSLLGRESPTNLSSNSLFG